MDFVYYNPDMPRCSGCKRNLPETEFAWRDKARTRRASRCRRCQREYGKAWYHANADHRRAQIAAHNERTRRERIAYLRRYKADRGCADCGEDDPIVLEFDHRRDKSFTIGNNSRGWSVVLAELEKCDVVCANCHRRRTHKRRSD